MPKKRRSIYAPSKMRSETGAFRGQAGEHLVLGHLLMNGFNAAKIPVDKGVDLFAMKKGKGFLFQAKLRRLGGGKHTAFMISEKNTRRKIQPNYYVFGMLNERSMHIDYLILSRKRFDALRRSRHIYHYTKGGKYRMQVKMSNGKCVVKGLDLTRYLNDWKSIK